MVHLNNTNTIITRADTIVREIGTRDPERIAKELGIVIKEVDFDRQKGVYKVIKRNRSSSNRICMKSCAGLSCCTRSAMISFTESKPQSFRNLTSLT